METSRTSQLGPVRPVGQVFPKGLEWRTCFVDEHDFQRWSLGRLRHLGYVVRVNSMDRKGRRQFRGLSDALVRSPTWEHGMWMQLEFKNPNKFSLSDEQQEESACGEIIVIVSWYAICQALHLPYEGSENLL